MPRVENSLRTAPVPQNTADADRSLVADFDTQLMLQLRAGDTDAAAALVRRNLPRVARYVARVVRNPRVVEDLSQDVFVQVLSNARRYRPTARFSTWLYRIATNVAIDYLRRTRAQKPAAELNAGDAASMPLRDRSLNQPERLVFQKELQAAVGNALDRLPPNQRVALTLFELEDFSYEQIAAVLDVTVDAVRSLLPRAKESLRAQLQHVR
ncbi:ECF RNA polymerase sigma-E factor [Phycisphaerae bacterium RAS1]|nr:ECF RNA polymerase sigma-E factor [Phycisphaerae bacterium RAS1]